MRLEDLCSDGDIARYLAWLAKRHPRCPVQAADLARAFSASGSIFTAIDGRAADVASSGGPSSLSTLLCPLFLRVAGFCVPKLAVPGRPAGGVDCLAQVRGYNVEFSAARLMRVIEECGYAHFISGGEYAPLDAKAFRLRQQNGLQDVPVLVVASLLSKKLAMGVSVAGLEIRVAPHGNFGHNLDEARANVRMYERTAELLKIRGRCALTDGSLPYQPYIGRGEALAALVEIFGGASNDWLREHVELCRQISGEVVRDDPTALTAIGRATIADLREEFAANLAAQGASYEEFLQRATHTISGHEVEILADRNGWAKVCLEGIRDILCTAQKQCKEEAPFPDPCGVILRERPGSAVRYGDVLATVRLDKPTLRAEISSQLASSIRVADAPDNKVSI